MGKGAKTQGAKTQGAKTQENNFSRQGVKLGARLFPEGGDRAAFLAALQQPTPYPPAILWLGDRPDPCPPDLSPLPALPWQPPWVDRLPLGSRPGRHSLHEAGQFYCLDFSSVLAMGVLGAIPGPVETVLDLCAAPGGKSLYSWVALRPRQLLCNEVVRKRVKILIANLKRCGLFSPLVFNLDPQDWAMATPHCAQVVLVDAPCSGQSLLAKGETVPGCFHPVTVNRNANRQRRILAQAAALVAPGGYLVYTTCTYSPEENEQVGTWFLAQFPHFAPIPVPALGEFQSPYSPFPAYRLWPHSGLGAGSFALLLHNTTQGDPIPLNPEFRDRHAYTLHRPELPE